MASSPASPSAPAGRCARRSSSLALFREKFAGLGDELDAGFGFDMARLSVLDAAPHDPAQIDLAGDAAAEADLDGLIDRIGARLGAAHVTRIVAARQPHPRARRDAVAAIAAGDPGSQPSPSATGSIQPATTRPITRPLRLFARPEPVEAIAEVPDGPPVRFRWRRALYRVARAEGPERIAAEWWRGTPSPATTSASRIRRAIASGSTAKAFTAARLTAPRWYLHGVFA